MLHWSLRCPPQREGRNFFGCDSFSGVPIEDSPIPGTGGIHFEQRVFNVRMLLCEQMLNCVQCVATRLFSLLCRMS